MPSLASASLHHISSAVVTAVPARCAEIVRRLEQFPDTEIHHVENGKIVIVMEGCDGGEIGGRLAAIALLDGVVSANLVFETVDTADDCGVGS